MTRIWVWDDDYLSDIFFSYITTIVFSETMNDERWLLGMVNKQMYADSKF